MKRTLPLLILLSLLLAVLASCHTTYEVQEPYIIRAPGITNTTSKTEEPTAKETSAATPAATNTSSLNPFSPTTSTLPGTATTPVAPDAPKTEQEQAPEPVPPTKTEEATSPAPAPVEQEKVEPIAESIPPVQEEPAAEATQKSNPAIENTTAPEEVTEPKEPVPFEPVDLDTLDTAFNYAYGIDAMSQLRADGVDFIGSYFARGVIDACLDRYNPSLLAVTDLQGAIDDYVAEYLAVGKTFDAGKRPESITEALELPSPEDIPSKFSYAYAFMTVVDLLESEVDILPSEFTTGALDALYGVQTLTGEEVEAIINEYILYLNEQYYEEQANLGESNLKKAELFFEANGKREGVRTLSDGIQLELLGEDTVVGSYPTSYDTVLIDYNLYAYDYETEDLEMIDADWSKELSMETAAYPLKQSISNMKVGQAQRSFIPPRLGFADTTLYAIEPNSILVYDIALNGIVK